MVIIGGGLIVKRGKITFLGLSVCFIGLVVLVLCIIWLPLWAEKAADMNSEYAYLRIPVLFGLYITTIPFYFALYQSLRLLSLIKSRDAFSELAVSSLRYIKQCAIVIATVYLIGKTLLLSQNALHPGIAIIGFVIVFSSVVIALFASILQELLKNALELKKENELTI